MINPKYNYTDQLAEIARAYDQAPGFDVDAMDSWRDLALHSRRQAAQIRKILRVTETDNPEPYPDHESMFDDIRRKRFTVSRANSEHPIWSVDENVAFRIVHDVLGHYGARRDLGERAGFDWPGEVAACSVHFGLLERDGYGLAMPALFTECLGQTGYAIDRGGFGAQKVAYLKVSHPMFNRRAA